MYYIYEIIGVKVGCTHQPKVRQKEQQELGHMIILEQHEDIMIASAREIQLQKEKGYKVDTVPYYHTFNLKHVGCYIPMHARVLGGRNSKPNLTKEDLVRGGKLGGPKAGRKAVESGQIYEAAKAAHVKVSCPHCNKVGSLSLMKRWHFDQCKEKP
jgi:hypothetical protein